MRLMEPDSLWARVSVLLACFAMLLAACVVAVARKDDQ